MFKFNFEIDDIDKKGNFVDDQLSQDTITGENDVLTRKLQKSEEVHVSLDILNNLDIYRNYSIKKVLEGGTSINHLVTGFVLKDINANIEQNECISYAEDRSSDLVAGIYEGGAKIWECTDDLLNFLDKQQNATWRNKRVLDIGCGCGLLGIFAYKAGAKVDFQDYNKGVLEQITIPNVLLNTTSTDSEPNITKDLFKSATERVRFHSGDWSNWLLEQPKLEVYDVILTAETIYNSENQQKLLNCFHKKLKPDGIIFMAAKTYYFGVGGSLRQFELLLKEDNNKHLESKVVWCSQQGVNREILQINRRDRYTKRK